jgi:branched-chain amino acid transport system permease protein
MSEFIQQLINGLSVGAMYALIAIGYTLVYGVLRFINFAHSDVFMVGSFTGLYAGRAFSQASWAGGVAVMLVSMLACAVLGMVIERVAYKPLRSRSKLTVLITAIGVSMLLQNVAQLVFGTNQQAFPDTLPATTFQLGQLVISSKDLVVLGFTLCLLAGLEYIVLKTRIGTAMRAVSFNPQAAALMGIPIDRIISFTFGLGSALAAAGGFLWAYKFPRIDPFMGVAPGLTAFVAAVLGGIGNITGAALGGLMLGVIETMVKGSRWSTWTEAIAFVLLILVLMFKPAGLMGRVQAEKV